MFDDDEEARVEVSARRWSLRADRAPIVGLAAVVLLLVVATLSSVLSPMASPPFASLAPISSCSSLATSSSLDSWAYCDMTRIFVPIRGSVIRLQDLIALNSINLPDLISSWALDRAAIARVLSRQAPDSLRLGRKDSPQLVSISAGDTDKVGS